MPGSGASRTCIDVSAGGVRITGGVIRGLRLRAPSGRVRVGLVATTALLLGGDEVELRVSVGDGCVLDLRDIAGTVAYDGAGSAAAWRIHLRLGARSTLSWPAEPFVVADGADVTRTLLVEAAPTARLRLRETLVLGRHGEVGGRLRNHTELRVGGEQTLVEDQLLDPATTRNLPGILRNQRIIDTLTVLGSNPWGLAPPQAASPPWAGVATFRTAQGEGRLARYLGTDLADSPLPALWKSLLDG